MSFWSASHLRGQLPHHEAAGDPNNLLSRGQFVDDDPRAQKVLAELRGGEASLHHLLLVHCSAPNRADPSARGALRVGLAMRFIDASVSAPLATLLRLT